MRSLLTGLADHKMDRKAPNSSDINFCMRVSNLQYAFTNLFIELIYNDITTYRGKILLHM